MVRRAISRQSHRKIGDCAAYCEQSMQRGSSLIGEEGSTGNKNVKPTTNNNFLIKIIKPNDNLTGASHYFSYFFKEETNFVLKAGVCKYCIA